MRYRGEKIVTERHGRPVAALISMEDLARLEESTAKSAEESYREALEEASIKITHPDTGKRISAERRLAKVAGKPLSEQSIEDRH